MLNLARRVIKRCYLRERASEALEFFTSIYVCGERVRTPWNAQRGLTLSHTELMWLSKTNSFDNTLYTLTCITPYIFESSSHTSESTSIQCRGALLYMQRFIHDTLSLEHEMPHATSENRDTPHDCAHGPTPCTRTTPRREATQASLQEGLLVTATFGGVSRRLTPRYTR